MRIFLIFFLICCNIPFAYADSIRYNDTDLDCDVDTSSCELRFEIHYFADDRDIPYAMAGCVAQVYFRNSDKEHYVVESTVLKKVSMDEGRGNMTVHMFFQAPKQTGPWYDDTMYLQCQPD